jgi:hypothetical protein
MAHELAALAVLLLTARHTEPHSCMPPAADLFAAIQVVVAEPGGTLLLVEWGDG